MADYIEIEEPRELRRANRNLFRKLNRALVHIETRTIGYPQGSFPAQVHFLSDRGDDVLYWSPWSSDDKTMAGSLFGHGAPGARTSLNIDVQINLPMVEFSRKSGGAFLLHVPTRRIVLAHRGIVTLGHGRVKRSSLFAEVVATVLEADTSNGIKEHLFVGELESPTLLSDIDAFSTELRRAIRAIKPQTPSRTRRSRAASPRGQNGMSRLRKYFDEFTGQREIPGRNKSVAYCYHGAVVRALRDALPGSAEVLKSREIDLVVFAKTRAFLFEVKTSSSTQSVYTALGQLTAHSPVVARHRRPGMQLIRVIVLPGRPVERLCNLLRDELDIRLLTFTRSRQGNVAIDGLNKILRSP